MRIANAAVMQAVIGLVTLAAALVAPFYTARVVLGALVMLLARK